MGCRYRVNAQVTKERDMMNATTTAVDLGLLWNLIDGKRDHAGLSYRDLGKLLGISPSMFTRIKQGKSVDMHVFCAILEWLQTSHRTVIRERSVIENDSTLL